jgi:hypothetical protein
VDIDAPYEGLKLLYDRMSSAVQNSKKFSARMKVATDEEKQAQADNFNEKFREISQNARNLSERFKELVDGMENVLGEDGEVRSLIKLTRFLGLAATVILAVVAAAYAAYEFSKWVYSTAIAVGQGAATQFRQAQGWAASIGGNRAFGAAFGTTYSAAGVVQAVAKGSFDSTSNERKGMMALGVRPGGDSADKSVEVLMRAAVWAKQYQDGSLDALADASFVSSLVSKSTLHALKAAKPEDLEYYRKAYEDHREQLQLTDDMSWMWSRFSAAIDRNRQGAIVAFQKAFAKMDMAGVVNKLSTGVARFVTVLLDMKDPNSVINQLLDFTTRLIKSANGKSFFDDLHAVLMSFQNFADGLDWLGKQTGWSLTWTATKWAGRKIAGSALAIATLQWKIAPIIARGYIAAGRAIAPIIARGYTATEGAIARGYTAAEGAIARGYTATEGAIARKLGYGGTTPLSDVVKDQSNRPDYFTGQMTVEGEQFRFGSGGANGSSSIPFGDYSISPEAMGPWGRSVGAMGVGNNEIWDPKLGRYRSGIEIHPGHSAALVSHGCIAVDPKQYPALKEHVKEMIRDKGHAYLHVGKDGVSISSDSTAKPSVVDGNGGSVAGVNWKQTPKIKNMSDYDPTFIAQPIGTYSPGD